MKRRDTRNNKIQYGKSFRYGSSEAAIKDLTRLEKKQKEAKEKAREGLHDPIPQARPRGAQKKTPTPSEDSEGEGAR